MKKKVLVVGILVAAMLPLGTTGCAKKGPRTMEPPVVIPRTAWDAVPMGGRAFRSQKPAHVTYTNEHYEMLPLDRELRGAVRSIQEEHLDKGWGDIGYHYLITPVGDIYGGRSPIIRGRTEDWEEPDDHLLVAVLGNYERNPVPLEVKTAIRRLTYYLMKEHDMTLGDVHSLREVADSEWPEENLHRYVVEELRPGIEAYMKEHTDWNELQRREDLDDKDRQRLERMEEYAE